MKKVLCPECKSIFATDEYRTDVNYNFIKCPVCETEMELESNSFENLPEREQKMIVDFIINNQ